MSFLKVKRKCVEDPKEILLLSKKHKLQEDEDKFFPVFQLTSPAVEEKDINDIIAKTIKNRSDIKTPVSNLEKMRVQMRKYHNEVHRNNRYQLFAAPRKLDDVTLEHSVPVIDVLRDGVETDENQNECVYDLYYSSTNIDLTDPDFSTHHVVFDSPLDFDWEYQHESDSEAPPSDEDDSNDENNWRNDYPDEEEDSDSEEDSNSESTDRSSSDVDSESDFLSRKLKKACISSDYSLSTSEDEYESPYPTLYHDEVVDESDTDENY